MPCEARQLASRLLVLCVRERVVRVEHEPVERLELAVELHSFRASPSQVACLGAEPRYRNNRNQIFEQVPEIREPEPDAIRGELLVHAAFPAPARLRSYVRVAEWRA